MFLMQKFMYICTIFYIIHVDIIRGFSSYMYGVYFVDIICNVKFILTHSHYLTWILHVRNLTKLQNKCIFTTVFWFIFNLQERKKLLDIYMSYYKIFYFLLVYYIAKCGHTYVAGAWLVLMRTGRIYPHAQSKLILSVPFCWLECLQMP